MKMKEKNTITLNAAQGLFLLGVFLKQFYIFSSGSFQLGDFCFMGSFLLVIVFVLHGRITFVSGDALIARFVVCVVMINLIYMFIYGNDYLGEFRFHKSSIYYIYNLFIILTFRQFCSDIVFLKKLGRVLQLGLFVQFFVALIGAGRYENNRFMGTFNDPNQCGFFILSSFLLVFIISQITEEGHPLLWYMIAFYLVMKTVSMGMLLGMGVLLAMYIFLKISKFNRQSAFVFIILAAVVLVLLTLYETGTLRLPSSITSTSMYQRALQKLWRFGFGANAVSSGGLRNLFIDRCWDRLIDYPFKILYGAGEGYYSRFPSARFTNNEIHSSILGPLFYYGIFPCSIWFTWTVKQLKGIKRELWAAYLALIVESVTLVNNRQPFFWMIFVLAGSCLAKAGFKAEKQLG